MGGEGRHLGRRVLGVLGDDLGGRRRWGVDRVGFDMNRNPNTPKPNFSYKKKGGRYY